VGAVEGEKPEDDVVDDERRDLSALSGHGSSEPRASIRWALFGAGEAVALGFLLVPDARAHLAAYLSLCFAGSVVAWIAARSLSASPTSFVLFCAAVFRLTLLLRPADLSEDVWRYLWDGRVSRAGISPWAYAPDDPAVAKIAPLVRDHVAHREIRTVYPPAAQAVFRVAAGDGPVPLKAVFGAADLAVVALLAGSGLPGGLFAAALYAFHPLAITESAGQGHVDSLGVALLVAAVCYASRGRALSAGAALAMSILIKYVSGAAALPFLKAKKGFRTAAVAAGVTGLVWVATTARGGVSPTGGLDQYATRWEFNSVLYPAMFAAVEAGEIPQRAKADFIRWKAAHHDPPWTAKVFPYFYSGFIARLLLAAILATVLVAIAIRVEDLWAAVLFSVGALLLFSPTLYPWYVLWALPFAAARRHAAFLWLSFAVPLSYVMHYPVTGHAIPRAAVLAFEYVPFAALLLAVPVLARRRQKRRRT
jgi:hypothetical protein